MSINIEDNKKLLEEALKGERGPDQTLIAEIGLEFLTTILRKNMDYGSSVFKPPILNPTLPAKSAIEVRLSDKITRFQQLKKAEANVKTESIQDTMRDFGAYGILWLIADEIERREKSSGEVDESTKQRRNLKNYINSLFTRLGDDSVRSWNNGEVFTLREIGEAGLKLNKSINGAYKLTEIIKPDYTPIINVSDTQPPTPETKLDIDKYLGQPLMYLPDDKALSTLDNTKIPLSEIDYDKYIYQTTTKPGIVILSKISD